MEKGLYVFISIILLQNTKHSYQNVEYLGRRKQIYCDHSAFKY